MMNLGNELLSNSRPHQDLFRRTSHHSIPYSTRTNLPQGTKELIANSSNPVPIFSINYLRKNLQDPARTMLLEKKRYEIRKRLLQWRLRKAKKHPEGQISKDMVDFIELLESDPDPTMTGEFNWHLQGGTLDLIKVQDDFKLIQPSMDNKYSLRLLDPSGSSVEHIVMPYKSKYHEQLSKYEILKSSKFIGIRKPKSVNFAVIDGMEDYEEYLQLPLKFSWAVEIAASTLHDDKLILIDVDNKLVKSSVQQLITDSTIQLPIKSTRHHFPVSINSIDQNVISYTNLKTLNLVDFRTRKPQLIFGREKFLMRCEEISYHKSSLHDNMMFLASSHVLYGIDIRNTKSTVIHWTHQLITQPTMLRTVKFGDAEVICLSSNTPGDLKIFNCEKGTKSDSWIVNHLPLKPRVIADSYSKLRQKGKFLLSEPIQQRVKLNTTGIVMIPRKNKIELFIQNSINDVFRSCLMCDNDVKPEEKGSKKMFKQWDEILDTEVDPHRSAPLQERIDSRELLITDVVNLKGIAKVLQSKKFQKEEECEEVEKMNTQKAPRWRTDLEDDKEYRDALAQHIFAEWNLDISDFKPHPFAEALKESNIKKDSRLDKVSRWLNTNSVDGDEPEIEDVEMPLQEIDTQPTQLLTQTTNIATQNTETSKKTKRVKGF